MSSFGASTVRMELVVKLPVRCWGPGGAPLEKAGVIMSWRSAESMARQSFE